MNLDFFRGHFKELLKEQHLTLNALAQQADLSEDTLRSLVYGKSQDVKVSTLIKIADVLDVSIDHLIGHSTFSTKEEEFIKIMRTLPNRSRKTISSLIALEQATAQKPSNEGKDILTVFLPTGNMKDGQYYDASFFTTLDITNYPSRLRQEVDFGIKILTDNLEPLYYMNDILLMSQKKQPEYNDIVLYLNADSRIFLRKYTTSGLEPINRFGKKILPSEMHQYVATGVVIKAAKEFNIEQYR